MIFIIRPSVALLLGGARRGTLKIRRDIALPDMISMLVTDLYVSGEREQAQGQEKNCNDPFESLEKCARAIRVLALEPSPLHREAVKTNTAVKLHGKQQ